MFKRVLDLSRYPDECVVAALLPSVMPYSTYHFPIVARWALYSDLLPFLREQIAEAALRLLQSDARTMISGVNKTYALKLAMMIHGKQPLDLKELLLKDCEPLIANHIAGYSPDEP